MSPFVSESQRGKFYELEREGKMSPETVREWEAHTPKGKRLPYHKKRRSKSKRRHNRRGLK